MDFGNVEWPFFWVVLVARICIFIIAIVFEFIRNGVSGESIANAGIYGIFVSQSNDLAMGYPIMKAVFAPKEDPRWASMLYIVTLSRVVISPFGFYMMEYGRTKILQELKKENMPLPSPRTSRGEPPSSPFPGGHRTGFPVPQEPTHEKNLSHILTRVFVNPLVIATFLGIIANLVFGSKLPPLIDPVFRRLGDSFNASALFVLGCAMHGHLDKLTDRRLLHTPLWLFVGKSIILPVLSRFLAVMAGLHADWVLFAFILGTLPSSEQVPFFAFDYFVPCANMIAPAMVLGTVLAAPVMFVSAQMVNISLLPPIQINDILVGSMRIFSAFGLVAGGYFLFLLWYNRRWETRRDKLLIGLIISQLVLNLSSEFCGLDWSRTAEQVRFGIVFTARMATRFWMLSLAMNELIHYFRPAEEGRWYPYFVVGSLTAAVGTTVLGPLFGTRTLAEFEYAECYLRYGRFQWTVVAVVDAISLLIIVYTMYRIFTRPGQGDARSTGGSHTYRPVTEEVESDAEDEEHGGASKPRSGAVTPEHGSKKGSKRHSRAGSQDGHDEEKKESSFRPVTFKANAPPPLPYRDGNDSETEGETPRDENDVRPPKRHALAFISDFYATVKDTTESLSSIHPRSTVQPWEQEASWSFGMGIFLIMAFVWMVINLSLSCWSATTSDLSEARIEMLLLDGVLSAGQSIWTWMAFGLASHVKSPLALLTRWLQKQGRSVINWRSS
jgi:predicted permease